MAVRLSVHPSHSMACGGKRSSVNLFIHLTDIYWRLLLCQRLEVRIRMLGKGEFLPQSLPVWEGKTNRSITKWLTDMPSYVLTPIFRAQWEPRRVAGGVEKVTEQARHPGGGGTWNDSWVMGRDYRCSGRSSWGQGERRCKTTWGPVQVFLKQNMK